MEPPELGVQDASEVSNDDPKGDSKPAGKGSQASLARPAQSDVSTNDQVARFPLPSW